jgi:hypothetical protein
LNHCFRTLFIFVVVQNSGLYPKRINTFNLPVLVHIALSIHVTAVISGLMNDVVCNHKRAVATFLAGTLCVTFPACTLFIHLQLNWFTTTEPGINDLPHENIKVTH